MWQTLIALLLSSIVLVSAVAPLEGVAVIQEQHNPQLHHHHQQQQQQEPGGAVHSTSHRRSELSASGSMSCPSKRQGAGQPKSRWPELQGKTVDEAKAALQQEAPGFQIQVIAAGHMATMDYRCDRIRLWLNDENRVSQVPMVG